jgi:ABC-type Fe3+-siderophore transport system permease subunit
MSLTLCPITTYLVKEISEAVAEALGVKNNKSRWMATLPPMN